MKISFFHTSSLISDFYFPLDIQIQSRWKNKAPIFITIRLFNQDFHIYIWRNKRDYTPISQWNELDEQDEQDK